MAGPDPFLVSLNLPIPIVVLCRPLAADAAEPPWFAACRETLTAQGVRWISADLPSPRGAPDPHVTHAPPLARWVADLSAAIGRAEPSERLVIVAEGSTVHGLPALALSQRAARRSIVGYVVVDSDLVMPPDSPHDWPGAPVTYVRTTNAAELGWRVAQLRGWRLRRDPVVAVAEAVALAR